VSPRAGVRRRCALTVRVLASQDKNDKKLGKPEKQFL
jgi:hypothetical protein